MGTYVRDAHARTGEPRAPNACERTARDADRPGPWRAAGNGPRLARGADTSQPPGGTELSDLRRGRAPLSRVWPIPTYHLVGLYLGDGCISAHPRGVFRLRVVLDAAYPSTVDQAAQGHPAGSSTQHRGP